jgi:hypothetical protein
MESRKYFSSTTTDLGVSTLLSVPIFHVSRVPENALLCSDLNLPGGNLVCKVCFPFSRGESRSCYNPSTGHYRFCIPSSECIVIAYERS